MDNSHASLIIANIFVCGAFVVNNVIEWAILMGLAVLWFGNFLMQEKARLRIMKMDLELMIKKHVFEKASLDYLAKTGKVKK